VLSNEEGERIAAALGQCDVRLSIDPHPLTIFF
jgi:hypothetical protein